MQSRVAFHPAAGFRIGLIAVLSLLLVSCGGGGEGGNSSSQAIGSTAAVAAVSAGVTPFIAFVDIDSVDMNTINRIDYVIEPKPGTFSKPVSVGFSAKYLTREGYSFPAAKTVRIPIFGLYANYSNLVDITLWFTDDSERHLLTTTVTTGNYAGSGALYMTPVVHIARSASDNLGFSFFYMKNAISTPVIVDTDGNVRWLGSGAATSPTSAWYRNGFIVGADLITRYELDGRTSASRLTEPRYVDFHHNLDIGPLGLLGEFDQILKTESTIAEFDPSGNVLKEWDMAKIIADYMSANGDDPALFVRPAVDWFHSNAVAYDHRDKSLIVSSRENFLIKIDYATGKIVWIFGDPTKYWYTFPSLRAKALTLTNGLYPIGQHAVSITPQGYLQVFNDGLQSLGQPTSAPTGDHRSYSTVSTYSIDERHRTAREVAEAVIRDDERTVTDVSEFDYGKSILSNVCSSAYTEEDGSMLVDYAVAASGSATTVPNNLPPVIGNSARLVGLNPAKDIAFDFEYPTRGCATSFYANVVRLESLDFD